MLWSTLWFFIYYLSYLADLLPSGPYPLIISLFIISIVVWLMRSSWPWMPIGWAPFPAAFWVTYLCLFIIFSNFNSWVIYSVVFLNPPRFNFSASAICAGSGENSSSGFPTAVGLSTSFSRNNGLVSELKGPLSRAFWWVFGFFFLIIFPL